MTVSSTQTRVSYSGNGTTTAFAVPFYFLANSDLLVVLRSSTGLETTQVLNTNYTVTGAGTFAGGTVTMTSAPASGVTVVISRNAPLTQTTDLLPNDRLPAESVETALDKATMLAQQLDEVIDRSIKFPITDSTSISATLPVSSSRAGKFLKFSSTGSVTVEAVPTASVSVTDFGATGDGTTDDTAAIQTAVNSVYAVFFPAGTYKVTSPITLRSNNYLYGEGAVSVVLYTGTATSKGAFYADSLSDTTYVENLTIRDLKVLGQVASLGFSEFIHLISLHGVRNCFIDNCVIEGFRGDGIVFGSGMNDNPAPNNFTERHNVDVTVTNCYIDGVNNDNRNGISVIDGNGVTIENNYFTRCSRSSMPGAIDIEPDPGTTAYPSNFHVVKNISILNNRIYDCRGGVASICVLLPIQTLTTPPSGFFIEGNYIDNPNPPNNNAYGIFFEFGNPFASPPIAAITEATPDLSIRVINNYVKLPLAGPGRAFVMWNCNNTMVADNTFVGGSTSLIGYPGTAVYDYTLKNNSFISVNGTGDYAVSIYTGARINIVGNLFKDCGAASGAARGAIEFNTGTTSYVDIIDNTFISPNGTFTQQAVRDSGHTFTGATNRFIGNTLVAGTNQFVSSINLNNNPIALDNKIPNLGVGANPTTYAVTVSTGATPAASFSSNTGGAQVIASDGTVTQAVGYSTGSTAFTGTTSNHPWAILTNNTSRVEVSAAGRVLVNKNLTFPAGTTTMTDGFPNVPSAAGTPTGTPSDLVTGNVPLYYDSTNDKLYAYNGSWKTASGSSLTGITSSTVTALGTNAGDSVTTASRTTAIGYDAGTALTSGSDNTAVGANALKTASGSGAVSNTAVGSDAGDAITTGSNCSLLGHNAGGAVTTGFGNTFVGYNSGTGISTTNSNTAVGDSAYTSGAYSNSACFGASSAVTGSNQVQLGDSSTTTYAYGAVQNRSDLRDKTDVQDTQLGLNFIMALRPRDYRWDYREDYKPPQPARDAPESEWDAWREACKMSNLTHDGSKKRVRLHHGLIAQEVKQTMDSLGIDFGGYQDHSVKGGDAVMSIGYNELIGPLIKAMQELKAEFDAYKSTHP